MDQVQTTWEILGISPTSDKKAIKQAFAKKSACCHPEEKPEEFDQLHKAYKTALALANGQADRVFVSPSSEKTAGSTSGTPHAVFAEGRPSVPPKKVDIPPSVAGQREKSPHPLDPLAISQLVEKGMELEKSAAIKDLKEQFQSLHASFSPAVNKKEKAFAEAMEQLNRLFSSQLFETAGWEPDFLTFLSQWLSKHRSQVNRAEAAALFRAYRFKDYGSPRYLDIPCLDQVHQEVQKLAFYYEREMQALGGMRRPSLPPPSPKMNRFSRFFFSVVMILTFLCFLYMAHTTLQSQSSAARNQKASDIYIEGLKKSIELEKAGVVVSPDPENP